VFAGSQEFAVSTLPQSPPQDAAAWLAALHRVMARVSAHADSAGGPAALAASLLEEFGVDVARIWIYDPADDALQLCARASQLFADTNFPDRVPLDMAESPIVRAIHAGEPLILDPIRETDAIQNRELFTRAGFVSYAGFPLLVGDRLVGAMSMFLRTPWPPAMLDALRVLAQQAALALDHARLIEETHALQGIAADLATSRETATLMNGLVERAAAVFGADASAVWMFDEHGRFRTRASRGLPGPLLQRLEVNTSPARAFFEQIRRNDRPSSSRTIRRCLPLPTRRSALPSPTPAFAALCACRCSRRAAACTACSRSITTACAATAPARCNWRRRSPIRSRLPFTTRRLQNRRLPPVRRPRASSTA